MPNLLGRMNRLLEDPFDDFFTDMPALSAAPARQQPQQEKKEDLVGQEEQNRFSQMRQVNALKMEMQRAIREENFERAAEIRDQLKKLEGQPQDEKKSN